MIPEPLDAVVFDMDGLLLDTESLFRTATFAVCAKLGHRMVDEVHLRLLGIPREAGNALLIEHFGESFDVATYDRECTAHYDELCHDSVPLRPGALRLLAVLQQRRMPMAVATSTERAKAEKHLRKAGILDVFGALVTRSDVSRGKPHPESFLKAAGALGVRPARCLALEDSHNGVRAAAAAGMATIMIPDLLAPTDDIRALCVGVLPSLHDVAALLETPFA